MVALNLAPTSTMLTVKLGSLTARAAFSHIPFLHSLQWMLQAICMSPNNADFPAAGPAERVLALDPLLSILSSVYLLCV